MAKLTSDLSNPLKGRRSLDKMGGRAKRPWIAFALHPPPLMRMMKKKKGRKTFV